jgi:hypothetical protein
VAGKNADGEGEKSNPHAVTIYPNCDGGLTSIDDLVGSWYSVGYVIVNESVYENGHTMTITKENETTIRISNLVNINALSTKTHSDEYLATVDIENMTITIAAGQECSPSLFDGTDQTILAIDQDPDTYCNNAGIDFVIPITVGLSGAIRMAPDSGRRYTIGGLGDVAAGFAYLGYKEGNCLGGGVSLIDLSWVKTPSSGVAPVKAGANTLPKLSSIKISPTK